MQVIHCRYAAAFPAEQYIYGGRPGPWGNPHTVRPLRCPLCGVFHARGDAIEAYRRWFYEPGQAAFREQAARELAGKVVGCWCKPRACHLDVVAEFVNAPTR